MVRSLVPCLTLALGLTACAPFRTDPIICGGELVELNEDIQHCGQCGRDCRALYGVSTTHCVEGVCQIEACVEGLTDINADPGDGCESRLCDGVETDVLTSEDHCGLCGHRCADDLSSFATQARCDGGLCVPTACLFGEPETVQLDRAGQTATLAMCPSPPAECLNETEACDGVDNDCDLSIDEGACPGCLESGETLELGPTDGEFDLLVTGENDTLVAWTNGVLEISGCNPRTGRIAPPQTPAMATTPSFVVDGSASAFLVYQSPRERGGANVWAHRYDGRGFEAKQSVLMGGQHCGSDGDWIVPAMMPLIGSRFRAGIVALTHTGCPAPTSSTVSTFISEIDGEVTRSSRDHAPAQRGLCGAFILTGAGEGGPSVMVVTHDEHTWQFEALTGEAWSGPLSFEGLDEAPCPALTLSGSHGLAAVDVVLEGDERQLRIVEVGANPMGPPEVNTRAMEFPPEPGSIQLFGGTGYAWAVTWMSRNETESRSVLLRSDGVHTVISGCPPDQPAPRMMAGPIDFRVWPLRTPAGTALYANGLTRASPNCLGVELIAPGTYTDFAGFVSLATSRLDAAVTMLFSAVDREGERRLLRAVFTHQALSSLMDLGALHPAPSTPFKAVRGPEGRDRVVRVTAGPRGEQILVYSVY